ncbi:MAG TPA: hypothetical protein PLD49_00925 [Thermoclostridium caenicola]|uniref:hypothetical protein n=1 Tax=Thermoclostridium caenicola TaxID=659425 RepID=UPI002B9C6608|nr:hypothetical protein [Thermoclostridium caenicola]HOK42217.1 hypothetical protein [Thermoclostridium caenicola]HOL84057.1 hypothetical protein [Thermoclostridium caenicola]HPO76637.1 hypothetical protein [Thermoclostridium caenicola]
MAMSKNVILGRIGIVAALIVLIFLLLCVLYIVSPTIRINTMPISKLRNEVIDNISDFNNAAQYMIRTEGKVYVSKISEPSFKYSSEDENYKPSEIEEESINIILYKLRYRALEKTEYAIMIIKMADSGIEKGVMKLLGTEFPPDIVDKEHIQDDWYAYTLWLE